MKGGYISRTVTTMIGIQLYTVRDLLVDKEGCERTIAALAEMGYECIQLAGGSASIETMKNSIEAAKKHGLKVVGILSNPTALNESLNELCGIARDAGCYDIGISGVAKCEESSKELVKVANELAAAVRAKGFSFSYHNHSHEYLRTEYGKRVMDILLDGFDKDAIDLMPDTYWLQHGGVDVRDFIETHADRIKILHLKDMKRIPDGVTFAEVGEGNLNMSGIIKTALKAGVRDFIVEQDKCDGDPLESARISCENLKRIFAEIK